MSNNLSKTNCFGRSINFSITAYVPGKTQWLDGNPDWTDYTGYQYKNAEVDVDSIDPVLVGDGGLPDHYSTYPLVGKSVVSNTIKIWLVARNSDMN